MRKIVKFISIILTAAYMLLIPLNALASVGPVSTAASQSDTQLLNKWKSMGFIDKSVSGSDLYKPIQKIDFIMYINKILNSSREAKISFSDIPADSWYGKEVAKAVASGFIKNEKEKKFEPFSNISRLDAAVIVAQVFGVKLKDKSTVNKIKDSEKLTESQLEIFAAIVEKGYLSEVSSGRYAPLGVIKLIDAISMLDKCIGQVIGREGDYSENISGNLLITSGPANLKNMKITGDLTIGEGVAEETVTLDNVSVEGKLVIRGGGPNSVKIKNSSVAGNLVIQKPNGNVSVVLQGSTTIDETIVKSGGKLSESGLTTGKGFVKVIFEQGPEPDQTASLQGSVEEIQIKDCNFNVNLNGDTKNVILTKEANAKFSLSGGTIKKLTTSSASSTIELTGGTVDEMNVDSNAKGNRITVNGAIVSNLSINAYSTIDFKFGTIETITFNNLAAGSNLNAQEDAHIKKLIANSAATVTGTGKIDSAYIYANNVKMGIKPVSSYVNKSEEAGKGEAEKPYPGSVSFVVTNNGSSNKLLLMEGATEPIKITGLYPSGSTLTYISSDNSIAVVSDTGVVKAIAPGSTKVHVTGQYEGYNPAVVSLDVTVATGNVTIPGTLTISPVNGEAGKNIDEMILTYTAVDNLSNGTLLFKLPAGFAAYDTDTVKIGSAAEKAFDGTQIPNSQTISLTNIDLQQGGTVVIKLKNKLVPVGGEYTFYVITDSDGYGPKLPTTGDNEGAVFTADSLRRLVEGINYSTPEYGSTGGSIQIAKLSTLGFFGSTKWAIAVTGSKPSEPNYDEDLTGMGYVDYSQGQDIAVSPGQNLRLVALDDNDKIKGFADITIDSSWIRPYDAFRLDYGMNYFTATGISAGTVRFTGLNYTDADHWMIRVQDAPAGTVFKDSVFTGAGTANYTEGDDISAAVNQHIILAAVDSSNRIKAYTDISVTNETISKEAGNLEARNHYSLPSIGTEIGTTTIQYLNKANLDIDKWMLVKLSKEAVKPSLGISTAQYSSKYTEGNAFFEYNEKENIPVAPKQHLLLVGVKTNTTTGDMLIQAYSDITVEGYQIRGASAPEIPDDPAVIGPLEMGSVQFTTRIPYINTTGSAILSGTDKFMIRVQNQNFEQPQLDSLAPAGFSNYTAGKTPASDITPGSDTVIVLLATDKDGRIKAYKNIAVNPAKIRPADAPTFTVYRFEPGDTMNSTTITGLPAGGPAGVTGFNRWEYKVQKEAFEKPYVNCTVEGTETYPAVGKQITGVSVGYHVLILAVNAAGEVLAYADETLNTNEIKQPQAETLIAKSSATPIGYNYTMPEPGKTGGTTMIKELSYWNIPGAQTWYYLVSSTPMLTVDANGYVPSGFAVYRPEQSVTAYENQYFILLATDNNRSIKAFASIPLTAANISLPVLKSPDNYNISMGSTAGTTSLKDLKFTNLPGATRWMYAIGNEAFAVPSQGTNVSSLSYKNVLTEITPSTTPAAIAINANQYIVLLAVDNDGIIKGYTNILVDSSKIKPLDAPEITGLALEKGSAEGTTRFSSLDISKISGAAQWWYCVQSDAPTEKFGIDTTPPNTAKRYNYTPTTKPDISVQVNEYIVLFATDSTTAKKIKAYGVIKVTPEVIQTPFAKLLQSPTDYSGPRAGTKEGTTTFTLLTDNVPDKASGTIVWKYKTSAQKLPNPHFDEAAAGYLDHVNGDFTIQSNNWILVVATIDDKIKAYFQLQVGPGSITPIEAPKLIEGSTKNYTHPEAGSQPGTTKFAQLDPAGLPTTFAGWVVKVSDTAQKVMQGDTLENSAPYTENQNINAKMQQYLILAAVDRSGKVLAYSCIQITNASELKPPLQTGFDNNYSGPQYGTVKGTTQFMIDLRALDKAVNCVAVVSDSTINLVAGSTISYATDPGTDYTSYRLYSSLSNIAVKPNQYVVLIAVNSSNEILAYANIKIPEAAINPGYAFALTKYNEVSGGNYSELTPGAPTGTVRFTYLNKVGAPGLQNTQEKWIVRVVNSPVTAPLLNTVIPDATAGYVTGTDIDITQGKYVVLYVVDASTNAVKGFACIQVRPEELEMEKPVPGAEYYTTSINTAGITMPAGTTLKYLVQNTSQGIVLLDGKIAGLQPYTAEITVNEGQYLLLAAVDGQNCIKAYKEFKLDSTMIKLPNTSVALSGTLISGPVSEDNIRSGGKTLVITLNDGKWVDNVATNSTLRNALFAGLNSSDTSNRKVLVDALTNAGQACITRSADGTVVTITLPAVPGYDISKDQTLTLTIPGNCLIGNKAITADQNISVRKTYSATLTGAFTEDDISTGSTKATIKITLNDGATWVTDIATNATVKNALLNSLKADVDTDGQWAQLIANGKVARTSATVVTITLPKTAYDISAEQTISVANIATGAAIGVYFDIPVTGVAKISPVTIIAPAVIQSVTATTGKYKLDDTISISVKFDKNVTVTGTPTLPLQIQNAAGTVSTKNATYASGSGTNTLVFKYKVLTTDKAPLLDYKAGAVLSGTIVNAGTSTAVNKALPPIGAASLGASNVTVDGVVGAFASGYPKIGTRVAENEADILVKLSDTATIYYVVVNYSAANTVPTADQIKDGTLASTLVVNNAGTYDVTAVNTEYAVAFTGLTESRGYTVYMYSEDVCGNKSAVASINIDKKPPMFTAVANPSDYSVSVTVNTDEPGNIYVVALANGSKEPTSKEVKANSKKVVQAVTPEKAGSDITLQVTGLTVSTDYDIYVVCEDALKVPNLSAPLKLEVRTSQLALGNVDVDLANNLLLNTNTLMQYSLNGTDWVTCTAPTTKVSFVYYDNATTQILYLRETNNQINSINMPLSRGSDTGITRSLIDYNIAAGTITNLSDIRLEFSIAGSEWRMLDSRNSATMGITSGVVFVPGDLKLRKAATSPTATGSKDAKLPSSGVIVDGIPGKGDAPILTVDDMKNEIVGLSAIHEYSIDGGAKWTPVVATVTPTFPGTKKVLVRFKATASLLSSKAQELNFTANVIKVVLAPATDTQNATVKIIFEENTNVPTLSKEFIRTHFQVGTWAADGTRLTTGYWGTDSDIDTVVWTSANVITITYKSMTGVNLTIGNEVRLSSGAAIQNSAKTSGAYTCKGIIGGTVPQITSIKAVNANNDSSFSNGDKLVITFDQATNKKAVSINDLAKYLILTDISGNPTKTWSKSNAPKVTIEWTSDKELTITFNDVSDTDLAVGDKIRISSDWGLKDAADTSGASTSTQVITGSFKTP